MSKNYAVARVVQYTQASISKAERHIERKNQSYENMNVDLSQTPQNVHFKRCEDATYNQHLNRLVEEGTVSLRGLKQDAKVFDEMIFDVNTAYFEEHGGYDYAIKFYWEVYRFAQKEYGVENIVSAVMHADELNSALTEKLGYPVYHYHLHVVALPVVEKEVRYSKRCKDPELVGKVKEVIHQISHSKKWASQKVTDEDGKSHIIKSYSLLQDRFFEHMRDAGFEDFERGERGSTAQHLSVTEYKVKKETERLENLQITAKVMEDGIDLLTQQTEEAQKKADKAQARVDRLVPKTEQIEDLAREYTGNADQVLPQPDVLESAKSYREKKAMPLYRKIISVLRNLFNKYLTLKHDYEDLQRKYEREIDSGNQLRKTIKTLREEKDSQSGIVAKFYALCRGFGEDYIESQAMGILEREAQERQQKKLARKRHERDAR
ncbi:MAG: plasmid recombination protein [Oscillospiraceae bacterium]|nr:plasmid recombination protein [Oscillospiraceae bacterium]